MEKEEQGKTAKKEARWKNWIYKKPKDRVSRQQASWLCTNTTHQ
jgi:hypothetical protein